MPKINKDNYIELKEALEYSKTLYIQVDGYIPKGCTGCSMVQDNKIMLMGNGKGKILPNLYISEFDSFSEHSAYISKFSKEEMFFATRSTRSPMP